MAPQAEHLLSGPVEELRRAPDARAPQSPAATTTRATRMRYRQAAAWLFTIPGLLVQFFFGWLPVGFAFVVSFQRYHFVSPPEPAGFQNFLDVFADPLVLTTFKNTLY